LRKTRLITVGFEDRKVPQPENTGGSQKMEKGKEKDLALEAPQRSHLASDIFMLAQWTHCGLRLLDP
jgi:hypothetical protein